MIGVYEAHLPAPGAWRADIELIEIAIRTSVLSPVAPFVLKSPSEVVRAGDVRNRSFVAVRVRVIPCLVCGRRVLQVQPGVATVDDVVPAVTLHLHERGR